MAGACQAPSPSDTIPHLCLSTLLQDRRKTLSKHTPHSSGTSHMRLPQSSPAVICRHAPRQDGEMHCAACGNAACCDGRCSVLRWASQRCAFSGQELCTSPKSAQGESVHPPKHVPECFSSPIGNSAARQQGMLPRSALAQLLFYRCRVPFTAPYAPAPVAAAD